MAQRVRARWHPVRSPVIGVGEGLPESCRRGLVRFVAEVKAARPAAVAVRCGGCASGAGHHAWNVTTPGTMRHRWRRT